jgi:hypothetical protein
MIWLIYRGLFIRSRFDAKFLDFVRCSDHMHVICFTLANLNNVRLLFGMPFGPADVFESNPFTWDCMSIAAQDVAARACPFLTSIEKDICLDDI